MVKIDPLTGQRFPLDEVVAVLAASMHREAIDRRLMTLKVLLDPNFLPDGAFVAEVDGKVIGFCLAIARQVPLENAPSDADRGYITLLGVLPEHRRQGIGRRLIEAAEGFLSRHGRSQVLISSYAPNYFAPGVDTIAYPEGLGLFTSLGYTEVYRPLAMQTDLWSLVAPDWVRDLRVQIEPWHEGLVAPLLDFAKEHFPGDWVRVVRETSHAILDGHRPDRLLTAFVNGAVAGFSHYDRERFGPIGVAPAMRGRGIGQALTLRTLEAQREAGFRASWFLWSDDRTAERLYHGFGFKEVRRFALLRKVL